MFILTTDIFPFNISRRSYYTHSLLRFTMTFEHHLCIIADKDKFFFVFFSIFFSITPK